jgi:hypothetical protein
MVSAFFIRSPFFNIIAVQDCRINGSVKATGNLKIGTGLGLAGLQVDACRANGLFVPLSIFLFFQKTSVLSFRHKFDCRQSSAVSEFWSFKGRVVDILVDGPKFLYR